MSQMFRSCPDCRAERQFEQYHGAPGSCPDSPDGDCAEWFCSECGAAILTSAPHVPAPVSDVPSKVA
jgi:hypothetical protein